MPNLTLHPLWHTAMPAYQHAIGACTHLLSALAIRLMATKTPAPGRPFARYLMLLQVLITLVDFNFGFLAAPISLFPIPGGLCNGVLCTAFGISGHYGITLMFFTTAYVGVAIIFCFHFKFLTILEMASHRRVSNLNRAMFRVLFTIVCSIPCLIHLCVNRSIVGGPEFIRKNYPSLYYLFESPQYRPFVYDPTLYPGDTIIFASTMIFTSTISSKTRMLQRKLMLLLIVQTIVPLTIQCLPYAVYAYSMVFVALKPDISNCFFCVQMTHASIHTAIVILTTSSYREPLIFLTGEISDKVFTSDTNFMRVSWEPNGGVNVRGMMMTFRGVPDCVAEPNGFGCPDCFADPSAPGCPDCEVDPYAPGCS